MEVKRPSIGPLFAAAAGLMAGSLLFSYAVGRMALESGRRVTTQRMILQHIEQFVSSLKDVETGQRGYLLTGEAVYLEPYRIARGKLRSEIDILRDHAKSGEIPSTALESIISLSTDKLAEIDSTLQIRREHGFDDALDVFRKGEGRVLMSWIRDEADQLIASERAEIAESTRQADHALGLRAVTFLVTGLFNLAFIGWAYRRLFREVREQEHLLLETSRQKELVTTTLSSIGDGVIVTDAAGRITFINPESERLTRWNHEDATGRPLADVFRILNEHTRMPVANPVEKVLLQGRTVGLGNHTVLLGRDGAEIPIDDSAAPIRLPDGSLTGAVLVFRDVTLQRQQDEACTRLAAIVDSSSDAILSKNMDGIIRTWNSGAERLFGYSADEIVGQSTIRIIPQDRQDEERSLIEQIRQGRSVERQQTVRRTKDGRLIRVSATSSPLRDADGRITGASTILRDISELMAAQESLARGRDEMERLVEERTAKLREMIDELQHVSYAITHDMRAPLRAMGMFAQLLLEDAAKRGLSPEMIDYCRRIVTGADRMDALIHDALNYNRAVLQELPLEPVALHPLIMGLLVTYPNLHPDKADIRIEGNLPVVMGNPSLLTQCFSNLLGNAVKFVEPGTRPRVHVWAERQPMRVRIWVEDNGIGIPKQAQARLFGMFQKLDNRFEGTGVGLAIVRKVVDRMGGAVGVESDADQGSRFWVDLPLPPERR